MIKLDTPYLTPDEHVLKIVWDECPENPRTGSNLGTFVMFEKWRCLSDDNPFDSVEELIKEVCKSDKYIWRGVKRYDHPRTDDYVMINGRLSGWDVCTCGIIYVSKEDVREIYNVKKIMPNLKERIYKEFDRELEIYSNYVNGRAYGCELYDLDGEVVDTCYGFYSKEDAVDFFDYNVDDLVEAKEIKEVKIRFEKKE